jgi:hypothetical protein
MRLRSLLASLSLVSAGVGLAAVPTGPSVATVIDPSSFVERWCSSGSPTPCTDSATHNGSSLTADDPSYQVQQTGVLSLDYTNYVMWQVVDSSGADTLADGDTWSVTLDMGSMKPRYTEGYAGGVPGTSPDAALVTRTSDGDGTYHVTITGTSVRTAESCNDSFPVSCDDPAPFSDVHGKFSGEVWDLATDSPAGDASSRNGFDRYQNLDGVQGPFAGTTSDGGYVLTFDTYNAARYYPSASPSATPVPFAGRFGMRLPFAYLRTEMGVPDPDTLPASLLVPTVTGTGSDGTWTVVKDDVARAFFVSVHGIAYPDTVSGRVNARTTSKTQVRTLRVKRGVITPYAPKNLAAKRTATHRGRVSYAAAKARGARPTGYTVRCVNLAGTHTVTVSDSASPTVVTGLRGGKAYDCRVRARSKAGPGTWSVKVRMPARP